MPWKIHPPCDSIRGLFIPDRWRSLNQPLSSGHLTSSPSQKRSRLYAEVPGCWDDISNPFNLGRFGFSSLTNFPTRAPLADADQPAKVGKAKVGWSDGHPFKNVWLSIEWFRTKSLHRKWVFSPNIHFSNWLVLVSSHLKQEKLMLVIFGADWHPST